MKLLEEKLEMPYAVLNKKDMKSWTTYSFVKLDSSEWESKLAGLRKKNTKFEKGKIPTDVWKKNNHTTSKEYAGWHPTQKPIELLERIIKANTHKGGIVLDCFSGSGSTAVACNNTGRKFVGCELDKDYYEKSLERIEKLSEVK